MPKTSDLPLALLSQNCKPQSKHKHQIFVQDLGYTQHPVLLVLHPSKVRQIDTHLVQASRVQ